MDGNIFLKEGSATNTIPQERLGRKLGAPVRPMLLGRGTWPLYMTSTTEYCFIGGTDAGSEGVWRWSDETPWDYDNWARGQPDNRKGSQHYLLKFSSGKWDDGWDGANPFICQSTPGIPNSIVKLRAREGQGVDSGSYSIIG